MTKSIVLGAAGFLGSHLLAALNASGHEAWGLDIRPPTTGLLVSAPASLVGSVVSTSSTSGGAGRWILVDYTAVTDWQPILAGAETIFHCLGTTLPATSNADPIFDLQTNLLATVRLLQGAVIAGVQRVVYFSSGGTVYGQPHQIPIPETHPTEPLCSYGIVKLATEKYLHLFQHLYGLDYLILRLSNPYGELQNPAGSQGFIAVALGKIASGEPIPIWGDGRTVRDYIYVKDAMDGVLAALAAPGHQRIYNVGSGAGVSLQQLITLIERVTGVTDTCHYLPPRPTDVSANVLDIGRLRQASGWQPCVDLETGIYHTWQWQLRTRQSGRHKEPGRPGSPQVTP